MAIFRISFLHFNLHTSMIPIRYLIIVCICFFQFSDLNAQYPLPESYLGKYQGVLHIYAGAKNQILPMEFHLLATDSAYHYDYRLIYMPNDSVRDERVYSLIYHPDTDSYEVDEHNGIRLSTRLADHGLYSLFEVQGGLLTSVIQFQETYVDFSITYSAKNQSVTTGGSSDDIPEVISYPVGSVQKARLVKMAGNGKP